MKFNIALNYLVIDNLYPLAIHLNRSKITLFLNDNLIARPSENICLKYLRNKFSSLYLKGNYQNFRQPFLFSNTIHNCKIRVIFSLNLLDWYQTCLIFWNFITVFHLLTQQNIIQYIQQSMQNYLIYNNDFY